jgi:F-type H+-transporting ATPase subunit epsilon
VQKIDLEIVTPERLVLSDMVDEVVLPGNEGYLGVLPGHAPLLTGLAAGEVAYRTGGRYRYLAVSGGFAEVLRNRVSILAETCERSEEIDLDRALRARERAEKALAVEAEESEFRRAEVALRRAVARIQAHEHGRS